MLNKKRCCVIFIIFMCSFIILGFKVADCKFFNLRKLEVIADNQYRYKEKINELNYLLLDCNENNLLDYYNVYYVVIDPNGFRLNNSYAKQEDLEAFKIILKSYNKDYNIEKELNENKNLKIKWIIDKNTFDKLKKIKGVNGFYVYKYSKIDRDSSWWNIENLITNVNRNKNGKLEKKDYNSIEMKIAQKVKDNEYIYDVFKKDVNGNIIKEFFTKPINNINVKLTLDKNLQHIIKDSINDEPYSRYEQIGVILMEADTGKIRAMVQKDDSKPNVNIGASTQNGFYAGSILKILVEEAGIESGNISLNHIYNHKNFNGLFEEHEDYRKKTVKEALIKSSNNIFVQIGSEVGIKNINDMSKKHGLYDKILGFDAEQKGNLEVNLDYVKDGGGDSLQAYIGQKTRITPIEAISIPNTIVNKGVYIKPQIIDSYLDVNNNPIEKEKIYKNKIISEMTANILKNHMIEVVSNREGTAKKAYIEGIEIGGKTGTSKRIENIKDENSGNEKMQEFYDGWFVGFFKLDNKYYSMVVFVQNIGKDINASGTAVPIFKTIVENSYKYLNKF